MHLLLGQIIESLVPTKKFYGDLKNDLVELSDELDAIIPKTIAAMKAKYKELDDKAKEA